MSRQSPLIEDWKQKFAYTFEFHPDREAIMDRILSPEPISVSQLDKWFREADECADMAANGKLQELSGEPDEPKVA